MSPCVYKGVCAATFGIKCTHFFLFSSGSCSSVEEVEVTPGLRFSETRFLQCQIFYFALTFKATFLRIPIKRKRKIQVRLQSKTNDSADPNRILVL